MLGNLTNNKLAFEIIAIVCGYLLGSVNFAIVVSKMSGQGDIRDYGSGNAGASNITRTMGWQYGIITVLGDVLKGTLAVFIGTRLVPGAGGMLAGAGAFFGHRWPIFFDMRGGKSVATLGGVFLGLDYRIALWFLGVWAFLVLTTRYMSTAASLGVWILPFASKFYRPDLESIGAFAILLSWCVFFFHRENRKRMRKGLEPMVSFKLHPKEEKYG